MPGFRYRPSRRVVLGSLAAAPFALGMPRAVAAPSGKVVMAFHVTISPAWFDPSTAPPQITPFGVLYAIHDGLVRAYPGTNMGPSLAESWTESADGLIYEFKLRPGLSFHNGDPLTTEDVKFSFERYKGAGATELKEQGRSGSRSSIRCIVRFHLKEALARLHEPLWHHRHRGRAGGAEELLRAGGRRRLPRSTHRRWVPTSTSASSPGSNSCSRPSKVLAQGPAREDGS